MQRSYLFLYPYPLASVILRRISFSTYLFYNFSHTDTHSLFYIFSSSYYNFLGSKLHDD